MREINKKRLEALGLAPQEIAILLRIISKVPPNDKMEEIIDKNLYEEAIPFEGGIGLEEALYLFRRVLLN